MARIQPGRLATAARVGWDRLAWWRDTYTFACEQMAGPWYDPKHKIHLHRDRLAHERAAVNLLQTMMVTYLSDLVGSEFDVASEAKQSGMGAAGELRAMHLAAVLRDIKYARTDMRVVMDALLGGLGIWRIGNATGTGLVDVNGELIDPGKRFVKRVAPGNLTRDPLSRDPEEDQFVGDRFEVDREIAMELFPESRDLLNQLSRMSQDTQQADPNAPKRVSGWLADAEISDDRIELWHLHYWDGRTRLECIIPSLESNDQFIMAPREYEGPEEGPYEFLGFLERPDRSTPVSPAGWMLDLHLAVAEVSSRLVDDAVNTKRINVTRKGADEDALAIEEAQHGDTLQLNEPESLKEATYGGMAPQMLVSLDKLMQFANEQGLDFTQAAGRRSQGGSATEASIVSGNAQKIKQFLYEPLRVCRSNILKRLSWYEDVSTPVPTTYPTSVTPGLTVDLLYDEQTREGTWQDYSFSLRVVTPASLDENMQMVRTGELMDRIPTWIQAVAAVGGNVEAAVDLPARVYGAPELRDIFPTQQGMLLAQYAAMQGGGPNPPIGARGAPGQEAMGSPMQNNMAQTQSDAAGAVPPSQPASTQ